MAITNYMLFYTPTCPKCPNVKEFMKDKGLEKKLVDAATFDGLNKAKEFNIMGVPTVVFFDAAGNEVARSGTIEEIQQILEDAPEI